MKKLKSVVNKTVIGTLSSSILVACADEHNFGNNVYGHFADDTMNGIAMLDINDTNLSETFISKLQLIDSIIEEIINDRQAAKAFIDDPDVFLASKSKFLKVELSSSDKALLMAFADDDIMTAVRENNAELFLQIARERGYIGLIKDSYETQSVKELFKTEEEYQKFVQYTDSISDPNAASVQETGFFILAVCLIVIGAVVAAIAAEIWVAVDVASNGGEKPKEKGEPEEKKKPDDPSNPNLIIANNREPVMKIWTDNNGSISNTALYNEMIDTQVEKMMSIITKEYSNIDRNACENILRINLEGYYGIRK